MLLTHHGDNKTLQLISTRVYGVILNNRTLYHFPWTSLSKNNPTDILTKNCAVTFISAWIQDHSIIREKFAAKTGSTKIAEVWCPTPSLTSSTKQTNTPAARS